MQRLLDESQLGGARRETAMILHEGWVEKESRYLGRWRPRWMVLFRDHRTNFPRSAPSSRRAAIGTRSSCQMQPSASCWLARAASGFQRRRRGCTARRACKHFTCRRVPATSHLPPRPGPSAPRGCDRAISKGIAEGALRLGGFVDQENDQRFSFGSPDLASPASVSE